MDYMRIVFIYVCWEILSSFIYNQNLLGITNISISPVSSIHHSFMEIINLHSSE